MDFPKHQQVFSTYRMQKYLQAAGHDQGKALCIYKLNIQLSQALYPLISILEVALRNAIDVELIKHFSSNDWLITQRNGFANHVGMVKKDNKGRLVSDHYFTEKLVKAESNISVKKSPITHGRLLSELTFGFWIKFFDPVSIKVLKGVPLLALKNKPSLKLTQVHDLFRKILDLRNRISHNEPICFNKAGNICFETIEGYEKNICDAISWIDKDLETWSRKINFFKPVFIRMQAI